MVLTVKQRKEVIARLEVPNIAVASSIDLRLKCESESRRIFQELRKIINCCHVGQNAPKGPYVAIYPHENKGLQFLIN